MNPNDTDGHQVGNGLGAEQPNTFAPNTGVMPNTVTSETFSTPQQSTFTPNTSDAFNAPQAPIISSTPDPEDKKENSITRAFGGRSRASRIAAQAPAQPSTLHQNAPDFFQQSMQQQDIILNNEIEQKAKGKKGLIIGGIVGGLALIAIIVAAVVSFIPHGAPALNNKDKEAIAAWNKLVNYMLSGANGDEVPEIDKKSIMGSNFMYIYSSSKERYDKWISLKDDFLAKRDETIFVKDETIKEQMVVFDESIQVTQYEVESKEYSYLSDLIEPYKVNDYNALKEEIVAYFENLKSREIYKFLYEAEEELSLAYLDAIQFYDINGCIVDNAISCNDIVKSSINYKDIRMNINVKQQKVQSARKDVMEFTFETASNINKRVQEL